MIKKIVSRIGLSNIDRENIKLIKESKYFDEKYYLQEKPELKGDAATDYYYNGWKEGKSPNHNFSTDFYLKSYKDVKESGMNPLVHFIRYGESENRLVSKDLGENIKKTYELICNYPYFYKFYIVEDITQNINLFINHIDENIAKLNNLFKYVINETNKKNYTLRIIYSYSDFEELKKMLLDNKLELPPSTKFINLKSNNFLEVGLDDIYISTSLKTTRALLNTYNLQNNIYFYINNIKKYTIEESYEASIILNNKSITCLVENEEEIKEFKEVDINYNYNHKKIKNNNTKKLYCMFGNNLVSGIELLNDLILKRIIDDTWKIIIISKKILKFHLENDIKIYMAEEITDDANLVINLTDKILNGNYPIITGNFIYKENINPKIINITNNKEHLKSERINSSENKIIESEKLEEKLISILEKE